MFNHKKIKSKNSLFELTSIAFAIALLSNSSGAAEENMLPPAPGALEGIESQCGPSSDFQDVEFYDGLLGPSTTFVDKHEVAVGQLQWNSDLGAKFNNPGNVNGTRWCTGTLIRGNLFLTAGHCFDVSTNDGQGWDFPVDNTTGDEITPFQAALNMHVNFGYQLDGVGNPQSGQQYSIVSLREYRNGGLDYAIIELSGNPSANYGFADVSADIPEIDDALTIIQHPAGQPKKIEAGSYDGVIGGFMTYGDIDTLGGSSGSGVLNLRGEIVGVHTNGGCDSAAFGLVNRAVPVNDIVDESPLLTSSIHTAAHISSIQVEGTPYPSYSTGTYVLDGEHGGYPMFRHETNNWLLYRKSEGSWKGYWVITYNNNPSASWDAIAYSQRGAETPWLTTWNSASYSIQTSGVNVTGASYPRWSEGEYLLDGEYGGYPTFRHETSNWLLYRKSGGSWAGRWVITYYNEPSNNWDAIAYSINSAQSPEEIKWN